MLNILGGCHSAPVEEHEAHRHLRMAELLLDVNPMRPCLSAAALPMALLIAVLHAPEAFIEELYVPPILLAKCVISNLYASVEHVLD